YLLSTYTARKLGMRTTGNAGGSHNMTLSSRLTSPSDDFAAMLKKMGTGLLVTELIGQGVNYITGDYSRGAFGYWVKNGVIQHAVQEITIAGNLRDMFASIAAVGADTIVRGTRTTGSILIPEMAVAGNWRAKPMCLIAFSWNPGGDMPLLLLANRDEYYARPSAPAAWWPEPSGIWAGRDLEAVGTWLGVTQSGRFAALTNYRTGVPPNPAARSRGELVAEYLAGDMAPGQYAAHVMARANEYNGF